ncbi:MAG TPA: hypothetical protein P5121_11240 [Caldilineaceae bacterium]|nr:hypothetical protein [Caldilineaceae bacterium]
MSEAETITPELNTAAAKAREGMESNDPAAVPLDRRAELVQRIWETLDRNWFLSAVGSALCLLYLFTLLLPQMPGQLQNDPTGARRWILQVSENYGPLGNAYRALGLFNVLNSPLLQLLVIALGLILLIRLGNQIARAWRLYQLPRHFRTPTPVVGVPVPISTVQPVYRLRQLVEDETAPCTQSIEKMLQRRFDAIQRTTVAVQSGGADVKQAATSRTKPTDKANVVAKTEETESSAQNVTEERLLVLANVRFELLRPVLYSGLFLLLLTVWINILWGWKVNPDPLAPGTDYRSASQGLVLHYEVLDATGALLSEAPPRVKQLQTETSDTSAQNVVSDTQRTESPITAPATRLSTATVSSATVSSATVSSATVSSAYHPTLFALVGETQHQVPIGTTLRLNWGQTVIASEAGPPALFLRTVSNEPQLSRLGQSQTVPSMGLLFPSPGSEEAIVVAQTMGLRIIRLPSQGDEEGTEQFLAEVYDRNNELIERIPIESTLTAKLTAEEQSTAVEFIVLPGIEVAVAYRPAMWLFWLALLLVLVGVVGYVRRPTFVLWQLAPWPVDRTVAIVQSDEEEEFKLMAKWLEEARS